MHPASQPLTGAPDVEGNYKLKTLLLAPFSCTLPESVCGLDVTQRGVKQNDVVRRSHLLRTHVCRAKEHWLSAPTMTKAAVAAEVDGSVENGTLILSPFHSESTRSLPVFFIPP